MGSSMLTFSTQPEMLFNEHISNSIFSGLSSVTLSDLCALRLFSACSVHDLILA